MKNRLERIRLLVVAHNSLTPAFAFGHICQGRQRPAALFRSKTCACLALCNPPVAQAPSASMGHGDARSGEAQRRLMPPPHRAPGCPRVVLAPQYRPPDSGAVDRARRLSRRQLLELRSGGAQPLLRLLPSHGAQQARARRQPGWRQWRGRQRRRRRSCSCHTVTHAGLCTNRLRLVQAGHRYRRGRAHRRRGLRRGRQGKRQQSCAVACALAGSA